MANPLQEIAYATTQGARVAWFMAHLYATRPFTRRAEARQKDDESEHARRPAPGPGTERMLADMARLFARELDQVRRGVVPWPADHDGGLPGLIAGSRRYFADLPALARRRRKERFDDLPPVDQAAGLPEYYLRNFHYQSGGYLTEQSARLYDTQVEVLFGGTANAMRRQALVPLAEFMRGRDQRRLALLDVGCGTGRFLRMVKHCYPRLPVTGLDLSEAYLARARRHLAGRCAVETVGAPAESMPFAAGRFDAVTSVFLFHELPGEVRRQAAREIARVLKPGGLFVLVDSLQLGDEPAYDGMLEGFARSFHEPYYGSYLREDLAVLFAEAGLEPRSASSAFLSKVMAFARTP